MSIRLMTRIWDSEAYSGGTLLVLLALADFANDDGKRIFPHVETLAKKARLSVRATQLALETLRKDGVITPVGNAAGGRGKSVEYQMDVERVQKLRPDQKGEVRDTKGCNQEQERVQPETERVQSATSHIEEPPEPSVTVTDPPAPAAPASKKALFDIPDWIPQEVWAGFVEMRQKIRHPLTPRAVKLLVAELEKLRDQGHDPIAIINESTMKSWRGFFAPKQEGRHAGNSKTNGNGTSHQRHRAGWSELLDAEAGEREGVPESGQLALGAPEQRHSG